jgi:type IV secretion system protein VirB9
MSAIRHLLALVGVGIWLAPMAHAAVDPQTRKDGDPRIRYAAYTSGQVYRLTSTGLTPLEIVFAEGELPEMIAGTLASTDQKHAKDWYAFHHDNVLILQPLHAMAPSILFVGTGRANGQPGRNYAFELATRDGNVAQPDGEAYVQVNMTYPADEAAARTAAWRAHQDAVHATEAKARLAQAQLAGPRNWRYLAQGSSVIQPLSVSDDGQNTMLLFPPHAAVPVPYIISQDGKESIVQTTSQDTPEGLLMILHTTVAEIVLRRGKQVCALYNQGYDPIGKTPGTGTLSADVVREVRTP